MTDHLKNRASLLEALQRELVGPAPAGDELKSLTFDEKADAYRPWRQAGTGEEILQWDRPCKRYGVGVLYPVGMEAGEVGNLKQPESPSDISDAGVSEAAMTEEARKALDALGEKLARAKDDADPDEFDLSLANAYKPSSMAVSFLVELPPGAVLEFVATAGRYEQFEVTVAGAKRTWWRRQPVRLAARFDRACLSGVNGVVRPTKLDITGLGQEQRLSVELRARPYAGPDGSTDRTLATACLVNRSTATGAPDELSLFQVHFGLRCLLPDGTSHPCVLPYPARLGAAPDLEDKQVALLYRDQQTFAVGHGCAADWSDPVDGRAERVTAEVLPQVQVPSMTNEVKGPDGASLESRMDELAGLVPSRDGSQGLTSLIAGYGQWIESIESQAAVLPSEHAESATANIQECRRALDRMREGLKLLQTDALVAEAFKLANHAMLLQQLRHPVREPRAIKWDAKRRVWAFSEPYAPVTTVDVPAGKGCWRPFQIAFLLMSIGSTARHNDEDRDNVELIWFPTGGGKTEAYLGLSAFTIFLRRLQALKRKTPDEDAGVQVLMRYTLRLLTAQQFQRATALLCAMEHIRRARPDKLGSKPFSIGIWVGGTPNTRGQALDAHKAIEKGDEPDRDSVVLDKCPWCRARMGPIQRPGRSGKSFEILGHSIRAHPHGPQTVVAHCPDPHCEFFQELPVQFIDDDIYDPKVPPVSLLIGTVDKFAMIAWRPASRRIFGIGEDGSRVTSPPGLVLQDELHLISGPLGSMVGLFETLIEELCTDRRVSMTKPKIVTSTATIRGYREQVRAVFARDSVTLFPPSGLSAADSYFGSFARNEDGSLKPGRLYVGVNAPGLGSMQTTQIRAFTALLQAPVALPEKERDPWWTLLMFFNSLRELGGGLTLFQSDILDYIDVVRRRAGADWPSMRKFRQIKELTGRLENSEVREALAALEVTAPGESPAPVDACLASNIIEVGVDVDRLSLLAVVGQPKTTAQYIQVTGRVGRKWWERPGLIVTLYSASKPRDRSHFEKFRTYHERLYAQVEPTSVTPFSRPAVQRALHAAMVAFVRQTGPIGLGTNPCPAEALGRIRDLVARRADFVDADEKRAVLALFDKRVEEWRSWAPLFWERNKDSGLNIPLLRFPGEHATPDVRLRSWETPTSMRNVDAECDVRVSTLYG